MLAASTGCGGPPPPEPDHKPAVAAARTALLEPALKAGAPVSVWMRVPIEFKPHL